jgi:hypothetical protein
MCTEIPLTTIRQVHRIPFSIATPSVTGPIKPDSTSGSPFFPTLTNLFPGYQRLSAVPEPAAYPASAAPKA